MRCWMSTLFDGNESSLFSVFFSVSDCEGIGLRVVLFAELIALGTGRDLAMIDGVGFEGAVSELSGDELSFRATSGRAGVEEVVST